MGENIGAPEPCHRTRENSEVGNLIINIDFKLIKFIGNRNIVHKQPVRLQKCLNCGQLISGYVINSCCSEKCEQEYHLYLLEGSGEQWNLN